MKKGILLLMMAGAMICCLSACKSQDVDGKDTEEQDIELAVEEIQLEEIQLEEIQLPEGEEVPSVSFGLQDVLEEINMDVQPGTAGNHMTAIRVASHLLDWGAETDMSVEEIKQTVINWLSDKGNEEQVAFSEKMSCVYEAYQQLLGTDAEELLASTGCENTRYPWSDSSVETVEAIIDVVQLPEDSEYPGDDEYPGEDVVELVNLRGDTTTVYKLVDGRYMDRIEMVFIFDGVDTWTDENGVEWNKAVYEE